MIAAEEIKAVIELYTKHGWKLRRVLLTGSLGESTPDLFGKIPVEPSKHDGLWFSRRSKPDCEAWELRRLSGSPFALVEVIDDGIDEAERDALLRDVENRMFEDPRPVELSH
jgi:hypothetical protein